MFRKPWLYLPSHWAHKLAPMGVRLSSQFFPVKQNSWRPVNKLNLNFKNPLGLAGGADKNATNALSWQRLGAGFVEVGTVTPEKQTPNPGRVIKRHTPSQSLWNKMGFPNEGMRQIRCNLAAQFPKLDIPIFVNIGKNRWVDNDKAYEDYEKLIAEFRELASAFVINISSPNTQNLRDLQQTDSLFQLISHLEKTFQNRQTKTPLLVKLSPDTNIEELPRTLDTCLEAGAQGFVLTNTTTARWNKCPYPSAGGVSGAPLKELSLKFLHKAVEHRNTSKDYLIVSVGGILTSDDVFERLDSGADLVEVYTALVYQGPYFFRQCALQAAQPN